MTMYPDMDIPCSMDATMSTSGMIVLGAKMIVARRPRAPQSNVNNDDEPNTSTNRYQSCGNSLK